jgi:hypothetical protein
MSLLLRVTFRLMVSESSSIQMKSYRMSGSVTISMSPAPALLRSICDVRLRGFNVDFAVSWVINERRDSAHNRRSDLFKLNLFYTNGKA